VKVTDAKTNITTAQCDSVGRMIALTSPDAGLTKYMHATNGNWGSSRRNLRSVTKKIQYRYETKRLKTIVYPTMQDPSQVGAFRTPTLRNVAQTGSYMHTGRLSSLADVVDFYNAGGGTITHPPHVDGGPPPPRRIHF